MRQAIGSMLAILLLAGCAASEPQKVSESRPTVDYSFQGDQLDEAVEKAEDYCADYDLDAKLIDVDDRTTDKVAHFECV